MPACDVAAGIWEVVGGAVVVAENEETARPLRSPGSVFVGWWMDAGSIARAEKAGTGADRLWEGASLARAA